MYDPDEDDTDYIEPDANDDDWLKDEDAPEESPGEDDDDGFFD